MVMFSERYFRRPFWKYSLIIVEMQIERIFQVKFLYTYMNKCNEGSNKDRFSEYSYVR